MDTKWSRFVRIAGLVALVWACSEKADPSSQNTTTVDSAPLGAWLMYGSDQGLLKPEILEQEETTLVLADSTYSLTFQRPAIHFVYVESGKVYYDLRARMARFTVLSVSGVDWSSGAPRKLVLIPETVPFQRDPGTTYAMAYNVQDSLMSLAGSGAATSWFVRAPR
jgi:hypothetical protein